MSLAFFSDSAYYIPAFFFIKLPFNFPISGSEKIKKTATLYHEYCHYFQDITSNIGLCNIITGISCLQDRANNSYQDENVIIGSKLVSEVATINAKNTRFVMGTIKHKQYNFSIKEVLPEYINGIEIHKLRIQTGDDFRFGAYAIMESMAYCLEQALFDEYEPSDEYPYNCCSKLAQIKNPTFPNAPEFMVVLCDVALMYSNPAKVFMDTLHYFEDNKVSITCLQQIYDTVLSMVSLKNGYIANQEAHFFAYSKNYNTAVNCIKELFGSDDLFIREADWIIKRLGKANCLRQKNPYFWVKILEQSSKEERVNKINDILFRELSLPIIFDNDNDLHVCNDDPGDINYDMFPAFFAVDHVLEIGGDCFFRQHCTKSSQFMSFVKESCFKNPWQMAAKNELCMFAKVWHRWGLTGKNVVSHTQSR